MPLLIIALCSSSPTPSSSYPSCSRSWGSTPGPWVLPSIKTFHTLRTTFASSSFCLPRKTNHPLPALDFSLRLNTPHAAQACHVMSLNSSSPNNNSRMHTEIQLTSRNRMINSNHPQSNNHRRGQCNL